MFGSLICLANPEVGRKAAFQLEPVAERKKVMVIGGGPAGMEAARIAASRGHYVTLYEAKEKLGGQWLLATVPPYKQGFKDLIEFLSTQINKLSVDVILGKTVTENDVDAQRPDAVIVATGARPIIHGIPGVDQENVITAQDVLQGYEHTGDRVIIVGGGGIGLETAEFLEEKGKKVTVVELLKKVGKGMGPTVRWNLLYRIKERGIKIFTSTEVEAITEKGVVVTRNGSKETWEEFDTVVMAVGIRSNNEIADKIKGKAKEVYMIGDAVEPRRGVDAMREGAEIGWRI
jgi:NADPH-dependent 2,4-dienoyl-CoA reductase/sulfur reductase-like enzyme